MASSDGSRRVAARRRARQPAHVRAYVADRIEQSARSRAAAADLMLLGSGLGADPLPRCAHGERVCVRCRFGLGLGLLTGPHGPIHQENRDDEIPF